MYLRNHKERVQNRRDNFDPGNKKKKEVKTTENK